MLISIAEAEKRFRFAAEQGDPAAQFRLGHAHYLKAIETGDFEEALNWIQVAADQNNSLAQAHLGYMHMSGQGVLLDLAKSKLWFHRAAQEDDAHHQCTYATMCWNGDFGSHDPDEAEVWWLRAATQGSASAYLALGGMYGWRHQKHRDVVKAYMWLTLAALHDGPGTCPEGARSRRDSIAESMTTDQISEAEQRVQSWLEEHPQVMGEEMAGAWRERVAEPPTLEAIAAAGERLKDWNKSLSKEQLAEAQEGAQKWLESYQRYEDDCED